MPWRSLPLIIKQARNETMGNTLDLCLHYRRLKNFFRVPLQFVEPFLLVEARNIIAQIWINSDIPLLVRIFGARVQNISAKFAPCCFSIEDAVYATKLFGSK
jgi:hypothetical protein